MRNLLVISNEGVDVLTDKMKKGWDDIKIIPFPKIPYGATETWIINEADEFVYTNIGCNSCNDDFEYVYLCPNDVSMVFYNQVMSWRYRRTLFVDPLYKLEVDVDTLKYTGNRIFVRWLFMKKGVIEEIN
jgi:hypothetical protein